jgi:pyridinium-3,5-biscarboxylic acid mononucleotide synthase
MQVKERTENLPAILQAAYQAPVRAHDTLSELPIWGAAREERLTPTEITKLLENVRTGKLSVEGAVDRLRNLPYEDIGYAKVDHHRSLRQGQPEVIFARGKAPEHVVGIVKTMLRNRHNILITRGDPVLYSRVRKVAREAEFHELSGTIVIHRDDTIHGKGKIVVVSAGTSDIPVAEEALVTAQVMGNQAEPLYDVGVAGIHRLLGESRHLREARVLIVAAGMEGALPSVVGGLVGVPVIAVPTSIGYGASFRGLAALLGMLNSCSPNVCVVNIDNGFGAGYLASLMNRL